MSITHVRYRAVCLIQALLLISLGRWLATSHSGWEWRDWLALVTVWIASSHMSSALSPSGYILLLQKPRQTWNEFERIYAHEMAFGNRRLAHQAAAFALAYAVVFVSFGLA